MIRLVLDDPRLDVFGVVLEAPAAKVASPHAHRRVTLDGNGHAGQAETALVGTSVSSEARTICGLTSVSGSSST